MINLALTVTGNIISFTGVWIFFRGKRQTSYAFMAAGSWILLAAAVATDDLLMGSINGLAAVLMTWLWWKGGGRARRAFRQLGAKSTARISALVRNLAPTPAPTS